MRKVDNRETGNKQEGGGRKETSHRKSGYERHCQSTAQTVTDCNADRSCQNWTIWTLEGRKIKKRKVGRYSLTDQ